VGMRFDEAHGAMRVRSLTTRPRAGSGFGRGGGQRFDTRIA
jgi:hypothetical protein